MIQKSFRVRRTTRPVDRAVLVGASQFRVWMEQLEARRLFDGMIATNDPSDPSTTNVAPAIVIPPNQPGDGLPIAPPANDPHHLNGDPDVAYIQWRGSGMYVAKGEWLIGIDESKAAWMTAPDMNQADWLGGDLYHTDRGMQAALDSLGAGYKFKEYLGVWKFAAITVPDGVSFDQLQQTLSKLPGFTGSADPDGIMWIGDPPAVALPPAPDPSRVYVEPLTDAELSNKYDPSGQDLVIYHLDGPNAPTDPAELGHQLTTIDWGDGTTTHEYIELHDNTIYLSGRHTFPGDGAYTVTMTPDAGGAAVSMTATVQRERDDVQMVDLPAVSLSPSGAESGLTQLMTFRGNSSDIADYFAWLEVPAKQLGQLVQVKPVDGSPGEYAVYANLSELGVGDFDITITLSRGIDVGKTVNGDRYFADNQLVGIVHGEVTIGDSGQQIQPAPAPIDPTVPPTDPTPTTPATLPAAPVVSSPVATNSSRLTDSLLDLKDDAILPGTDGEPIIS